MRQFDSATTPLGEIARAAAGSLQIETGPAQVVRAIVDDVREGGDDALLRYVRQFEWPEAAAAGLRAEPAELAAAWGSLPAELQEALEVAAANVRRYHERQRPVDWLEPTGDGARLGQKFTPLDSVGVYAPGGRGGYASSLIMAVAPAQVAGVGRIVVASPAGRDGKLTAPVAAAAHHLGLTEIYKMGGAQAVAALAYGTATVPAVDKIVGPGNIYVTLAKTMVYGRVGTDGLYGPSEVVVVADDTADPRLVAADLLSQAEHGPDSPTCLITTSPRLLEAVPVELEKLLPDLPKADLARQSLDALGCLALVADLEEAAELCSLIAPEHAILAVADPPALLPRVRHAGCIFLGHCAPVPAGDYLAGPSHILPTGRTARFSSGLGVPDFLKRSSVIETGADWLAANGEHIARLARYEGFEAHARAVEARLKDQR